MSKKELFPIGVVSERTGVNTVTLRAWERRYGLIQPTRTAKGHRLYSEDDIQLIQSIVDKLESGLSIGKVADHIKYTWEPKEKAAGDDPWKNYRERLVKAVSGFDEMVLHATYNEVMSLYPVDVVSKKLLEPLLQELGSRWEKDHLRADRTPVAEEHFFSMFVRNKLGARFHHRNIQNQGPQLLLACLPGEHHEFGLLLFALAAHERGYRLVMLGADMPLDELPGVVEKTGSRALVLSGSGHQSCIGLYQQLQLLVEDTAVPVFIGGDISINCKQAFNSLAIELLGNDLATGLMRITHHPRLKSH